MILNIMVPDYLPSFILSYLVNKFAHQAKYKKNFTSKLYLAFSKNVST